MSVQATRSRNDNPRPEVVVLCVDEAARDALTYWLSQSDIPTVTAKDGYAAAALIEPQVTRLIITDRVLPPWPGLATLLQLKRANAGLRVAFIDDGIPDTRIIARVSGADVLLARPLSRTAVLEVANAVRRAVE